MGYWADFYNHKKGNKDFIDGVKAAISTYAIWKDGKQLVGAQEKPIIEVFAEIERELGDG